MKNFFTNPWTIFSGVVIALGLLSIYGYRNWGWFSSNTSRTDCPSGCTCTSNTIDCPDEPIAREMESTQTYYVVRPTVITPFGGRPSDVPGGVH